MLPFVRSEYNYDMDEASVASGVENLEPSRTIQSDRDDADINVLVKRFGLTGVMPATAKPLVYQDFEDVFDFQSAMNAVRRGEERFNAMPADVRKRFNNDPQEFVEFCSDERNLEEMRKLGLAIPKKDDIIEAPVVKSEKDDGEAGS